MTRPLGHLPGDDNPETRFIEALMQATITAEIELSSLLYWEPDLEHCDECSTRHLWWYLSPDGMKELNSPYEGDEDA